jgi:hypothetical protein
LLLHALSRFPEVHWNVEHCDTRCANVNCTGLWTAVECVDAFEKQEGAPPVDEFGAPENPDVCVKNYDSFVTASFTLAMISR